MGRVTSRRRVVRVERARRVTRPDTLVAEEPLEIRVAGRPVTVTMRTPGHDVELAIGFLLTEGLLSSPGHVAGARFCAGADDDAENTYNVLDVSLTPEAPAIDPSLIRVFTTTSSCGICGKSSIEAVRTQSSWRVTDDRTVFPYDVIVALPQRLRDAQRVFDRTGGLHAAALCRADGTVLAVREDVGRHNAVDKLVGWAATAGHLPLSGCVLVVSGRASFELTQKALMAGVPALAAVSAPSSLAADLADEAGMTLIGFLRGESFNIYAGADRIALPTGEPAP